MSYASLPASVAKETAAALRRRVKANFDRQAVMRLLGARLGRVEPGLVEIELPFRPEFVQQDGFVHAGILTTVVDSAGGYAAYTMCGPETNVLTVELKVNFLRPAVGARFVARGSVVRAGRTVTVCRLEVEAVRGRSVKPCLEGLQTIAIVADARSAAHGGRRESASTARSPLLPGVARMRGPGFEPGKH